MEEHTRGHFQSCTSMEICLGTKWKIAGFDKTYYFSEDFCWLISRWISAQVVSSFYFVRLITRQLRKRRICPSYRGVTYCPVFCKTGAYDWNKFKKDQMRNGPRLLLVWLLIPSFEKVDKSFNKYFSTLVEKGQKKNWKQNMRKLRTSLGLIWAHLWSLGLTWEHMSPSSQPSGSRNFF